MINDPIKETIPEDDGSSLSVAFNENGRKVSAERRDHQNKITEIHKYNEEGLLCKSEFYQDGNLTKIQMWPDGKSNDSITIEEIYDKNYVSCKSSTEYRSGQKHGKEEIFNPNGSIKSITNYKDGKKDGNEETYIHGTLASVTPWKNGKRNGIASYYKDGKLIDRKFFRDGVDCTLEYKALKKVAADRLKEEEHLGVRLPKMSKETKDLAVKMAMKKILEEQQK